MSEPHSSGPGHETQDVNFDAIFGLAGLAVVLSVAIGLGVWMLFHDMRERQRGRMPKPSPLALEQKGRLPPQPSDCSAPTLSRAGSSGIGSAR